MRIDERQGRLYMLLLAWVTVVATSEAAGEAGRGLARDDGRTRGRAEAPVTLIEYSDFTCGFCGKFFRETWPRLKAKYVDAGLVRFVYRDFPRASKGTGIQAALASRCAGEQGRYWSMHDRLFGAGARIVPSDFERHASGIGLNVPQFAACVRAEKYVDAIIEDHDEGVALGFRGTPGFVLLRTANEDDVPVTIPGAFPFEIFEEEIDRLLTRATPKG
jgi:protein-disulfide isomerase